MNNKTSLKQSINLHWLRPDNALWAYGFSRTFGDILYKKLLKTDRDTFFEFKEEYCSKVYDLVEPFLDDDYYENVEKAYHAFFIKKK